MKKKLSQPRRLTPRRLTRAAARLRRLGRKVSAARSHYFPIPAYRHRTLALGVAGRGGRDGGAVGAPRIDSRHLAGGQRNVRARQTLNRQ